MKNRKALIILLCAMILIPAVIVVGLAVRNQQKALETAGAITLKSGEKNVAIPLTKLDREAFSGETVNGKGDRATHSYRGIELKTLLTENGVDLTAAAGVRVTSADQFSAEYTLEELKETGKIYLAVQLDGQAVEGIDKGTPGAQMVVFGDPNSKRNVRSLRLIEVLTAAEP